MGSTYSSVIFYYAVYYTRRFIHPTFNRGTKLWNWLRKHYKVTLIIFRRPTPRYAYIDQVLKKVTLKV